MFGRDFFLDFGRIDEQLPEVGLTSGFFYNKGTYLNFQPFLKLELDSAYSRRRIFWKKLVTYVSNNLRHLPGEGDVCGAKRYQTHHRKYSAYVQNVIFR